MLEYCYRLEDCEMKLYQFVSRCCELYNPINIAAQNIQSSHFSDEFRACAVELSSPIPTPIVNNDYTSVVEYFDRCRLHLIGA